MECDSGLRLRQNAKWMNERAINGNFAFFSPSHSSLSCTSVSAVINRKWKQPNGTPAFNTQLLIFIIVTLFLFAQFSFWSCICSSTVVCVCVRARKYLVYLLLLVIFAPYAFEWNKRRLMKTKEKSFNLSIRFIFFVWIFLCLIIMCLPFFVQSSITFQLALTLTFSIPRKNRLQIICK